MKSSCFDECPRRVSTAAPPATLRRWGTVFSSRREAGWDHMEVMASSGLACGTHSDARAPQPNSRALVSDAANAFVPAAGRPALTRFYDRAMSLTMREQVWRPRLAATVLAGADSGAAVVDVGCGTGTQAIRLASIRPDVHVIGIDLDPEALALAAAKPGAAAVDFRRGRAQALALPTASADRVLLVLVLHHLARDDKLAALRECRRVLRPGGRLHIVDWGRPRGLVSRAAFTALRLLDGFAGTRDHASGHWHRLVSTAGFDQVRLLSRWRTAFGELEQLVATRLSFAPAGTVAPSES